MLELTLVVGSGPVHWGHDLVFEPWPCGGLGPGQRDLLRLPQPQLRDVRQAGRRIPRGLDGQFRWWLRLASVGVVAKPVEKPRSPS